MPLVPNPANITGIGERTRTPNSLILSLVLSLLLSKVRSSHPTSVQRDRTRVLQVHGATEDDPRSGRRSCLGSHQVQPGLSTAGGDVARHQLVSSPVAAELDLALEVPRWKRSFTSKPQGSKDGWS